MMRRAMVLIASTAIAVALAEPPAAGITNGTPDGNGHPNVGTIVIWMDWGIFGDGPLDGIPEFETGCSGSLLSDRTFLTAGHCIGFLDTGLSQDWFTPADVFVTFDPDLHATNPDNVWEVAPDHVIGVTDWTRHPLFSFTPFSYDVAVLDLAEPVQGIDPVELPEPNFLGQALAAGDLAGRSFTNVGYGVEALDRSMNSPNVTITWSGRRMVSTSPFVALTKTWLKLQQNATATGEGGGCFFDSGSPHFFAAEGWGSNLVVSVQSGGDAKCQAIMWSQRLDLPEILEFLHGQIDSA